jgi:hypothetical protein
MRMRGCDVLWVMCGCVCERGGLVTSGDVGYDERINKNVRVCEFVAMIYVVVGNCSKE